MDNLKEYLKEVTSKYSLGRIKEIIQSVQDLKVLVIGDTIIDEYCFVEPRGGSIKDPMQTVDFLEEEVYGGGIIAIANHVSNFAQAVKVITLLGDQSDYQEFVRTSLNKNVQPKFFVKENSPTPRKRRYINQLRNEKIFMIEYINDRLPSPELEREIICELEAEIPKYDLVIVGDFGHGFISEKIICVLEQKSKFLAVNVQTNSANLGFNYLTKYNSPSFMTMDGVELSYALGDKYSEIPALMDKLHETKKYPRFMVTRGKEGAMYFEQGFHYHSHALTMNVKDVVGAGDAVYSIASLLVYFGCEPELIPFIGNCAGGIAVSIMGNKESVGKEALLNFIRSIYKKAEEEHVDNYFSGVQSALQNLNKGNVNSFVKMLLEAYERERIIYVFGNGGSGATASHFCGDLIKGVSYGLKKRFKVICLNDNTPTMMAIANDISYDAIFVEQLKNFLQKEDLVIGISGSGNSLNVVKALEYARETGAKTVAICGYNGGKIKEIADLAIHAEIDDMEISEDIHNLVIIHSVKRILTNLLNNKNVGEEYAKRIQ